MKKLTSKISNLFFDYSEYILDRFATLINELEERLTAWCICCSTKKNCQIRERKKKTYHMFEIRDVFVARQKKKCQTRERKKKHIICLKFVTYLLLDRKKNVRRKIIASVRKWELNVVFDVAIECVVFDVEIENFDVEIERVRELKIVFDVAIECVVFDVEIERVRFIICIILDFLIIIFSVIVFCIIIFFLFLIS